jgi:large subunit ribosomal protein L11
MAKAIKSIIKLQIAGGSATPAPPVGSNLGQHGVNIMDFCKQFNAKTANRKSETLPVVITVYADRSFDFIIKEPPMTELIKKKANITKGSSKAKSEIVGKLTWKDVEEIAKIKLPDLNATDIEQAKKIVAGSARSMGVNIE